MSNVYHSKPSVKSILVRETTLHTNSHIFGANSRDLDRYKCRSAAHQHHMGIAQQKRDRRPRAARAAL